MSPRPSTLEMIVSSLRTPADLDRRVDEEILLEEQETGEHVSKNRMRNRLMRESLNARDAARTEESAA